MYSLKWENKFFTSLSIVPNHINKIYKLSVTCFMELNNCGLLKIADKNYEFFSLFIDKK